MTKILRKTSRMTGAAVRRTGDDWPLSDIGTTACHPHLTVNPTTLYRVCANNNTGFEAIAGLFHCRYKPDWKFSYLPDSNCSGANRSAYPLGNNSQVVQITKTLRRVEGKFVRKDARLGWSMSNETVPLAFIIKHSSDGIHFTPSGKLRGRYDEGPANMYRFVDPQPVYGPIFYRLTTKQAASGRSRVRANTAGLLRSTLKATAVRIPFHGRPQFNMPAPNTENRTYSRHESQLTRTCSRIRDAAI